MLRIIADKGRAELRRFSRSSCSSQLHHTRSSAGRRESCPRGASKSLACPAMDKELQAGDSCPWGAGK